ncbi:MAG TPA: helix-turn-helix domain-containing protein [Gemmatimonadaceae bacterium]|nr:helix-turn-helix domain-containing protein [Gemmatimonadaceae bacterium]
MTAPLQGPRIPTGTRGQILSHLRRGSMTVDELAGLVGTTDNSVRSHLASLERDGLVKQEGVRRGAGAGKPAVLYALHPAAELEISSAYPPVLMAVVDAIIRELPADEAERLLRVVGHDLARSVGGRAAGDRRERIDAAARVLVALGGDVEVVEEGTALVIRGFGCPLSLAVSEHPEVCRAVETLVSDVSGECARQCCEHGKRPRCRFRIEVGDAPAGV